MNLFKRTPEAVKKQGVSSDRFPRPEDVHYLGYSVSDGRLYEYSTSKATLLGWADQAEILESYRTFVYQSRKSGRIFCLSYFNYRQDPLLHKDFLDALACAKKQERLTEAGEAYWEKAVKEY